MQKLHKLNYSTGKRPPCPGTQMNAAMSILHVLAKSLTNLEINMARASTFTAPTPSIIDAVNTSSPLAPSAVACSQLALCDRLLLCTT